MRIEHERSIGFGGHVRVEDEARAPDPGVDSGLESEKWGDCAWRVGYWAPESTDGILGW